MTSETSTMTSIGEGVGEWMSAFEQRRRARMEEAEPCGRHEDGKVGFCSPCQDEDRASRKETARVEAIRRVNADCDERFPARYRCAMPTNQQVLEWVESASKSRSAAGGLLLMGQTGTGKTHQAYGALRSLLPRTIEWIVRHDDEDQAQWVPDGWRATTYADLNASMRPSNGNDPEATLTANRDTHIMMIDDLAAARSSEWVEEHIYRLINGRYEAMRPTIFTTNLEPSALREAVGDRIASRLVESCVRVVLDGPDLRRSGIERPEICPVHGIAHSEPLVGGGDPAPAPVEYPRPRGFWEN